MPLDGVTELLGRFKGMAVAAETAGQRVVIRSQTVFEAAVKKAYTQSHTAGTTTPSRPGSPPAVITGTLRRGWVRDTPTRSGAASWSGRVFPTTIYARIHELGGQTGRGGATTLPARPVMAPTLIRVKADLAGIHVEEFNKVIGG